MRVSGPGSGSSTQKRCGKNWPASCGGHRSSLPLADAGCILLHVPGGPPPAEIDLISRIGVLDPALPAYAAFDLDPAGVRIARSVQQRTGLSLNADLMSPDLFRESPIALPITE